jgi:hypothetical protein
VDIGFEKTDQVKDGFMIYKKMGKIFLVKEFDALGKKDKVYYVKPLRTDKNG